MKNGLDLRVRGKIESAANPAEMSVSYGLSRARVPGTYERERSRGYDVYITGTRVVLCI